MLFSGLLGKRQSAEELFLFDVKKEPKNRHRFDAVGADQGCGPGPGECGHLTTAYSPGWGPVNKENDFNAISRQMLLSGKKSYFPLRVFNPFLAQVPQDLSRPS